MMQKSIRGLGQGEADHASNPGSAAYLRETGEGPGVSEPLMLSASICERSCGVEGVGAVDKTADAQHLAQQMTCGRSPRNVAHCYNDYSEDVSGEWGAVPDKKWIGGERILLRNFF